jgi:hypothetical protein
MSTTHLKLNPPTIQLPPCGRGLDGPCTAIIETGPTGMFLRCLKCNCVAPIRMSKQGRTEHEEVCTSKVQQQCTAGYHT